MKNKAFKIASILLFALVIMLPWGLSLAGADAGGGSGDSKEVRTLAEFPREYSNDYFSRINSYVNDHSPMRGPIIDLVNGIGDRLSDFYADKIVAPMTGSGDGALPAVPTAVDFSCVLSDEGAAAPTDHMHEYRVVRRQEVSYHHDGYTLEKCAVCGSARVTGLKLRTELEGFAAGKRPVVYSGDGFAGIHDWYFYSRDNSIGYVQGDNLLSPEEMADWKNSFEELKAECDKRGIDLVVLVCPNKEMVYTEYLPYGIDLSRSDSEKRESVMAEYMKANSSVHYVYPLQAEKTAKIFCETYSQQDTHWNLVGGFVAAMQIYAELGLPRSGFDNIGISEYPVSGGDLAVLGVGPATKYTDYGIAYKPEIISVETQTFSNTVLGSNDAPNSELRVLESNAPGNRKAVIIGDSFRRALTPFISKDYAKLTVGHKGNLDLVSNFCADADGNVSPCEKRVLIDAVGELGNGDLLILSSVERADGENADIAKKLTTIMRESSGR